jgi:hypothetical protein
MLEKAKDFLRRNDVRELLAISKSKLIKWFFIGWLVKRKVGLF